MKAYTGRKALDELSLKRHELKLVRVQEYLRRRFTIASGPKACAQEARDIVAICNIAEKEASK